MERQLAYIAGKPAVISMQKQLKGTNAKGRDRSDEDRGSTPSGGTWYRPVERLLLPWTRLRDGVYIDSNLVSAVQTFDADTMHNKNGVFQILGSDFFQTAVEGPFSWDGECRANADIHRRDADGKGSRGRSVCAFRPNKATFQLGPWWKIDQDIPEDAPFDETHIRDLPFFKFIHVDDKVAVAVGRSGGVALWTRMPEATVE